jgi:endonuclease/exonuclease/phosphatase family metal-dependent hydrolase
VVIRGLQADVLALQEVVLGSKGEAAFSMRHLERATGMKAVPGMTLRKKDTTFGNILLSAHPIQSAKLMDLSVGKREPRGAIVATLNIRGTLVRVVATHLGLKSRERKRQIRRILGKMRNSEGGIALLMGDLNEWNPFSPAALLLALQFRDIWSPPSYPSRSPILSLDRILVKPPWTRKRIMAVKTPPAATASDHLPVVALISPLPTPV